MNRQRRWLLDEIGAWRDEGLIDVDQAQRLQSRYEDSGGGDWGRAVFAGVGAVLFGLGVILLIAYNWQGMHRFVKLACVGGGLLASHGAGWWLGRPGGERPRLAESLHLLGTVLFGAGIWLVAQVYHIDEHYPTAFLVWGLGALSLAWALPSVAQGLLATALVSVWAWLEVFEFHHSTPWGAWLVALGLVPLAWLQRSRVLLLFALLGFLGLYGISAAQLDHKVLFPVVFLLAGGYLGVSLAARSTAFPESGPILRSAGLAVYVALLFLATFVRLSRVLFRGGVDSLGPGLYWGGALLLGLLGWGTALRSLRHGADTAERTEAALVAAGMALVVAATVYPPVVGRWGWLAYNGLFLAHGGLLLASGLQRVRWQRVALGSVMLTALVCARFLDLFDSLLVRAGAFLALGAALFVVGVAYSRRRQAHGRDQEAARG